MPLPTFSCRFNHCRWWSPGEVHVDCPHGLSTWTIQTFEVLSAKRPRQASLLSLNGPGGSPGHEWGAWRGLLALSTSNVWIVHVDSPCGRPTWTSAGDHHLRWLNLQKKVGRGTLDLELSLDSYSGAPRGPRASPGPQLGLQRNVTNLMTRGSTMAMRTRASAAGVSGGVCAEIHASSN